MSASTTEPVTLAGSGAPLTIDDRLSAGEPIRLLARLPVPRLALLQDAVALLGGQLELIDRPGLDGGTPTAPWLLEAGAVLALSPGDRERLRERTIAAPALLFAADDSVAHDLAEAGAVLAGRPVPLVAGGVSRRFTVAASIAALEPFGSLTLEQSDPLPLPVLLDPDPRGMQPLIAGEEGAALAQVAREDGGELWVTAVPPLARLASDRILRRRFHPGNFLELLPLLGFVRHALGERAWRRPTCQAAFMIDDPNLRAGRYGWVDYAALRDAGRRHRFHTSIAIAALDAGKTSRRTAAQFRASRELSLVMHGVYHTHHEFAQSVTPERARHDLEFGLAQMEEHRRRHGIACPPVMTFPFSRCSSEWMQAMRDVGLAAAVTGPNPYPFLAEFTMLTDPEFGMLPAETGHGGFPVLTRSHLGQQREDLLFAAWLGKPIIVYLHHEDLRGGVGPLVEIAEFVNRRLDAEWTDLGAIADANYQLRQTEAGRVARLFSNRVRLAAGENCVAVLKPGADRHADERLWADGREVEVGRVPSAGVIAALPAGTRTIVTGPRSTPTLSARARRPLGVRLAQGRRGLTELRDRLAPATACLVREPNAEAPVESPAFTG